MSGAKIILENTRNVNWLFGSQSKWVTYCRISAFSINSLTTLANPLNVVNALSTNMCLLVLWVFLRFRYAVVRKNTSDYNVCSIVLHFVTIIVFSLCMLTGLNVQRIVFPINKLFSCYLTKLKIEILLFDIFKCIWTFERLKNLSYF